MEEENSITAQGFTNSFDNFLQSGALLRHNGQWTLIVGPFVSLEKPNNSLVSILWPDFYNLDSGGLWSGSEVYKFSNAQFSDIIENNLQIRGLKPDQNLAQAMWIEPKLSDFAVAFNSILEKIRGHEINKAVPAVFARSRYNVSSNDLLGMLSSLRTAPDSLFVYGFWQNGEGVLGATPEVLFNYEDQKLSTMALAGTYPKLLSSDIIASESPASALLNDVKEREEHDHVVQDIHARLSQWGTVKSHGPSVLDLPLLCHLKTDFEVKCHETPNFMDLMRELHPTPALGVAPRSAGYKWLAEFPGQEGRAGFGAPFAFIENKKALCLVAIRSLQWNKNEVLIGSGCGVVAASQLEKEWRELGQKRLSVKKILGLEL